MLLPGRPLPVPQALCTGEWNRKRIIAYISNTSLVILTGVNKLLQTIYHDQQLTAIALHEASGKLAVATGNLVHVYTPTARGNGYINWTLQTTITLPPTETGVTTLSWGNTDELMVGGDDLTLWSTESYEARLLWRQDLPNPAKLVLFSPDFSLAVSIAHNDRLVKVWRRVSIGSGDIQFDFTYLPHPRAVNNLHWRHAAHPEETADNVLYTFAQDQVARVWAPTYPHDAHLLQLWTVVDLKESSPLRPELDLRYAYVMDSRALGMAAECAVGRAGDGEKEQAALQRLVEVANRAPEVMIGFDAEGKMSAWGLENVGCKSRRTANVFSIVRDEPSGIRAFRRGCEAGIQFSGFVSGASLVILAHFLDGRIHWLEARVDRMLDPGPTARRFTERAVWTGHSGTIKRMIRTADGRILLTGTNDNELYIWSVENRPDGQSLRARCLLKSPERVRRTAIIESGKFIVTLHEDHIALWDARGRSAFILQRLPFKSKARMLCLILLPESVGKQTKYHVAAVDKRMCGIAWSICPPNPTSSRSNGEMGYPRNQISPYIKQIANFVLPGAEHEDILAMFPVEPVGWNAVLSDNLDVFSREVATTVCASGLLISWTVKVYEETEEVKWLETSRVETGIPNPSYAKSSSIRKIALVDEARSELTIWDSTAGILEFQQKFKEKDIVKDLDWTSTPRSQSVLAVGFPHRVVLMSQLRYDYLTATPAWGPFREINIGRITPHPIGDSTWLHDGGLVIGSGNQLFVYPRKIEEVDEVLDSLHLTQHQTKLDDIFHIVSELNGPLPVYHPQFIQQAILAGKYSLVETIAVKLYKELRSYHEEVGLDMYLNIPLDEFFKDEHVASERERQRQISYFDAYETNDDFSTFDETLASKLCEYLQKIAVPHLTGPEQIRLTGIIESMSEVHKHRRSLDENGSQYLLFFRQYTLHRNVPLEMTFREFAWAYHSNSQDILVDLVTRNSQGRILWPQARESGMFVWLADTESLRRQMEVVARNHYTRTDEKDPVECSLYYLALRKKKVLTGLWRVASWHREHASTLKFLSNNFDEPRWRTAALKNAYALLAKHRYEYAAAFFLLADSLSDAINVCYHHMNDLQLAIAIARVYEGDGGPTLHTFLTTKVLPRAAEKGDRWLATWSYWLLKRRDMAVRALLSPLDTLVESGASSPRRDLTARFFLLDDPALTIFYRTIREKTLQTLKGAEKISPDVEFNVVLHTARLYDRMGCDLLALSLVKNWHFMPQERTVKRKSLIEDDGLGRRRRRSSAQVSDDGHVAEGEWKMPKGLVKPPVAVFEEPDILSWAF
ncbi:WD40 repeat-like protein [Ascodesmis nigricans]|uniref:WD40 repeat-like protein n=1 Tax=Ascodesmis nigricans TaxID=341454 RepID=A0A4S2N228_9PEZI|nr:WD40 repeat-like protein [Ascodesmis nigricans]